MTPFSSFRSVQIHAHKYCQKLKITQNDTSFVIQKCENTRTRSSKGRQQQKHFLDRLFVAIGRLMSVLQGRIIHEAGEAEASWPGPQ